MLSRNETFYQYIATNLSSSGILSFEQISGILLNIYSGMSNFVQITTAKVLSSEKDVCG